MNIENFLGIAIVATAFSLIFQVVKDKFGTNPTTVKLWVVGISLVLGGLYVWMLDTSYFQTVITILGVSSAIYAFFLKGSAN